MRRISTLMALGLALCAVACDDDCDCCDSNSTQDLKPSDTQDLKPMTTSELLKAGELTDEERDKYCPEKSDAIDPNGAKYSNVDDCIRDLRLSKALGCMPEFDLYYTAGTERVSEDYSICLYSHAQFYADAIRGTDHYQALKNLVERTERCAVKDWGWGSAPDRVDSKNGSYRYVKLGYLSGGDWEFSALRDILDPKGDARIRFFACMAKLECDQAEYVGEVLGYYDEYYHSRYVGEAVLAHCQCGDSAAPIYSGSFDCKRLGTNHYDNEEYMDSVEACVAALTPACQSEYEAMVKADADD